jgi:hypothetical protein
LLENVSENSLRYAFIRICQFSSDYRRENGQLIMLLNYTLLSHFKINNQYLLYFEYENKIMEKIFINSYIKYRLLSKTTFHRRTKHHEIIHVSGNHS